ncbi:MAG TPA: protein kinase, partial [Gammaproteobacteria bacterium]|nr:protein kinase [Gammaproteobacteria bacterium]
MSRSTKNMVKTCGALIFIITLFFLSFWAILQNNTFSKNIDASNPNNPINKMLKIDHSAGIQDYAIYNHELGKGSYSRVLLAKNIKTLEWLAVKIQPYSDPEDIQHEIKQLSLLGDYRDDTIVTDQKQKTHYLFMRLTQGTAVEKLYEDNLQHSTEELFNIIISSFYALQALHQKNIVHNDIHEGNLIYNPSNKKSQWVDMAFSLKLKQKDTIYPLKRINKNPAFCYNAPESTRQRGYATDMYQLGFMSLRLLLIFSEENSELREKYIDSREYSFNTLKEKQKMLLSTTSSEPTKNILSLLYRMIDSNAEKRPTLEEATREFNANYNTLKL